MCDIWQLVQNLLHPRQAQNMTQANQCENLRHFLIRILTLTRTQYDREENSYLSVSPWGGEELDHLFSALIFLTLFRVVSSVNEHATCVRVNRVIASCPSNLLRSCEGYKAAETWPLPESSVWLC